MIQGLISELEPKERSRLQLVVIESGFLYQ